MRRIALLLAGACLVSPAIAADGTSPLPDKALETAALLRDQGLQDNLAYEITEQLSTQVGPRLAGGPNDLKAREWMIAKFKELGFDEVWTEPVTFPKWERRSESAQVTSPWPQPLAVTALGNSAATPADGLHSELVILDDWQALQDAPSELLQGRSSIWRLHAWTPSPAAEATASARVCAHWALPWRPERAPAVS